jgi:hypothetical protein
VTDGPCMCATSASSRLRPGCTQQAAGSSSPINSRPSEGFSKNRLSALAWRARAASATSQRMISPGKSTPRRTEGTLDRFGRCVFAAGSRPARHPRFEISFCAWVECVLGHVRDNVPISTAHAIMVLIASKPPFITRGRQRFTIGHLRSFEFLLETWNVCPQKDWDFRPRHENANKGLSPVDC